MRADDEAGRAGQEVQHDGRHRPADGAGPRPARPEGPRRHGAHPQHQAARQGGRDRQAPVRAQEVNLFYLLLRITGRGRG